MAAVAHNPQLAARVGIPQSVGQDFNEADTGTGILKKRPASPHARLIAALTEKR